MASELHAQTLAFLRKYGATLRDTPGPLLEPQFRAMLSNVESAALDVLERVFGEAPLAILRSEVHEITQIDKVRLDLPELVIALSQLDFTVEAFRLALGIDGEAVARVIHERTMRVASDPGSPHAEELVSEAVGEELRRQGWTG